MYDIKQCVRGNNEYLFVWEQLVLIPNSDELWKEAEQQVKEENYLSRVVLTNPHLCSIIHQKIPSMVRQKIDIAPPSIWESAPSIMMHTLRTTKEPQKMSLDWNKVRVRIFPEGTMLDFPSEYIVYAHYQNKRILVEEHWKMERDDGDILLILTHKKHERFCLCLLTTQSI